MKKIKRRVDEFENLTTATGLKMKEIKKLPEGLVVKFLQMSTDKIIDTLRERHPDAPLVNKREIAKIAGYSTPKYFWGEIATMPGSIGHFYQEGIFRATHLTSARAWGDNIKRAINARNAPGRAERTRGWRGTKNGS